jgi:hypothetical protein
MTPATVYRIAREIEKWRGLLSEEEKWLQQQPRTEHRAEEFRRIDFYRGVLADAVTKLGTQ